jgi:mono/diheme cytochrome c family protein
MPPVKLLAVIAACCALFGSDSTSKGHLFERKRNSPSDLEITGMVAGVPPGTSRYVSYETLLTLPQVTVAVTGDANFAEIPREKIVVTGVYLDVLTKYLGGLPGSDLVNALCSDGYRANYSHDYVVAHHPIFALKVNGLPVKSWVAQTHKGNPGTYFITHAAFMPSFKVLSQEETPQIPVDIVKLDFSSTQVVFGAIAPHGENAPGSQVMEGYRIAQQHCYRCHNMGSYGGTKAKVTWRQIGAYAAAPSVFEAYILNPGSFDHRSTMQPYSAFDDATAKALQAYFQTFAAGGN